MGADGFGNTTGSEELGWTPLTGGGWFGFRNFRAKAVHVDSVRVYPSRPLSCVNRH